MSTEERLAAAQQRYEEACRQAIPVCMRAAGVTYALEHKILRPDDAISIQIAADLGDVKARVDVIRKELHEATQARDLARQPNRAEVQKALVRQHDPALLTRYEVALKQAIATEDEVQKARYQADADRLWAMIMRYVPPAGAQTA